MSEDKSIKLFKAVKELNIGMGTIVDFLASKGYKVEKQPMAKLDNDMYNTLLKEFAVDKSIKEEAKQISIGKIRKDEAAAVPEKPVETRRSRDFENEEILIKNAGNFTAPPPPAAEKPAPAPTPAPVAPEPVKVEENTDAHRGVKVVGKIDLDNLNAKPAEKAKEEPKVPEPVAEVKPTPAPEAPKAPEPVAEVKPAPVPEAPKVEAPKAPVAPVAAALPLKTPAMETVKAKT